MDSEPTFRRSSFCADKACVEVAHVAGDVLMRDGKQPDGPVLTFSRQTWAEFLDGAAAGEFR
jgi:Domain of unknown function (DUF397)